MGKLQLTVRHHRVVIGIKTRLADCRMTSKLYPTFIKFDNIFELITKIRFSKNLFEFIYKIKVRICLVVEELKTPCCIKIINFECLW